MVCPTCFCNLVRLKNGISSLCLGYPGRSSLTNNSILYNYIISLNGSQAKKVRENSVLLELLNFFFIKPLLKKFKKNPKKSFLKIIALNTPKVFLFALRHQLWNV